MKVEFEHPTVWRAAASGIFSVLIGDDARLDAETFKQIDIHVEKAEPGKRLLDLRRVQMSDLGPLSSLAALERLYLDWTQVSDLGPLSSLRALERSI